MSFDLVKLGHLVAVAECGSLARAAEQLGLSQPGLSKSLSRLEETVGMALFERRARGVEATAAGRVLIEHARAIGLQVATAEAEMRGLAGGAEETLVVGAGPSWLGRELPELIGALSAQWPDLRIRLVGAFNDRLMAGLQDGTIDVVLAALPDGPAPRGLIFRRLQDDPFAIVARRGHALASRRNLCLADLGTARWTLPPPNVLSRRRLEAAFSALGLPSPANPVETDSLTFMLALVRASDLLSFVTTELFESPEGQGVVPLDIPELQMARAAGLALRAGRPPPRVRAFLAVVEARAKPTG